MVALTDVFRSELLARTRIVGAGAVRVGFSVPMVALQVAAVADDYRRAVGDHVTPNFSSQRFTDAAPLR